MANGDPDWAEKELPEIEDFFKYIAKTLEDFSLRHNLIIEKYDHQKPSWDFNFRHPNGGIGRIDVMKEGSDKIGIWSVWTLDDYDTETRYSRNSDLIYCPVDQNILNENLEKMLSVILSWSKDIINMDVYANQGWKMHVSKKDFEEVYDKYPLPNM